MRSFAQAVFDDVLETGGSLEEEPVSQNSSYSIESSFAPSAMSESFGVQFGKA